MLRVIREGYCGRPLYFALLLFVFLADHAAAMVDKILAGAELRASERYFPMPAEQTREIPRSFAESVGRGMNRMKNSDAGENDMRDAARRFYHDLPNIARNARIAHSERMNIILSNGLIALATSVAVAGLTIWMVLARLRDIGWSLLWGLLFFSPRLINRIYGAAMTDALHANIQNGFLIGLVLLGFVPSQASATGRIPKEGAAAVPQGRAVARVTAASEGPRKVFGRRV